jgi:hypothetical protein
MASLTSIAVEFRGLIATSIPHIIDLLQNDNYLVRRAAVEALSKLSEQGMLLIWSGMVALTSIAAGVEMIHTDQEAFNLDTMIEAHTNEREYVGEVADLRQSPHRGDSERLPFRNAIPDSPLFEIASFNGAREATEKVRVCHESTSLVARSYTPKALDSIAATNITGPSPPKDNVRSKISKAAKISELHAFFVTLFSERSLHVPN